MKSITKKIFLMAILLCFFVSCIYKNNYVLASDNKTKLKEVNIFGEKIKMLSRVKGEDIQLFDGRRFEDLFLKGVNLGSAKPGSYPGEFAITKEEYLRWFRLIKDMNCNVIRVYTLNMPHFYEALYEFNSKEKEPLYVLHGIWLNEDYMRKAVTFDNNIINEYRKESKNVIDAIHGNANISKETGKAYGKYTKDVSQYVIGYILGVEWDSGFVERTNQNKKGMKDFRGEWVYTKEANPIEIFFAQMIEYFIDYEVDNYNMQKPIAITNWLTTDVIDHKDDIDEVNRVGNINVSKIKSRFKFRAGLFTSYHVYPYYPDFLHNDERYNQYIDENGNQNSYRAYLNELKKYHDGPIIISEFGVPESRGIAHIDKSRGFNQGFLNEEQQGEMVGEMIKDIANEDYAGAVMFSWQDEWFKRVWNTVNIDSENDRAYWGDRLTNEQYFGLLSFEPGKKENSIYIDGNMSDWKSEDLVFSNNETKLYMRTDAEHIYLRVNKNNLNLNNEEILIPIDITPKSGSTKFNNYNGNFDRNVDFAISIKGKDNSKIFIQDYYNSNKFLYDYEKGSNKNSNKFSVVNQIISKESVGANGKVYPPEYFNIGELVHGNSNPSSSSYNSLADFNISQNDIEIRIPWLMLNIVAPNKKMILDDFNTRDITNNKNLSHIKIDGIFAGAYSVKNNNINLGQPMSFYTWDNWNKPEYYERLKKSYYIIKDVFKDIN